jgi:endonuclease/exonuclease/phosphatase family metal-dependent hydrolase
MGSSTTSANSIATTPIRVLQMNLCDSGIAGCYTGRSVAEAASVIRAAKPDVVTLNEVCRPDVATLDQTLTSAVDADGGGVVVSAFQAAGDRQTADSYLCRNGQPYGIGLVVHIPAHPGYTVSGGLYPTQDLNDPEERAWLCLYAIGDFYACTTHLADTSRSIALAQCADLLRTIIPAVRERNRAAAPAVIGGDFNLGTSGQANIAACVPAGYVWRRDGGVQYVLATADLVPASEHAIAMHGTTDHPGLLVVFTASAAPAVAAGSHCPTFLTPPSSRCP